MRFKQRSLLGLACLSACFGVLAAPAKQTQLADRISGIAKNHFPDAVVSQDNGTLSAKHGTMVFTIHRHWKTGEILKETDQVEGPNYKGFMIFISVQDGRYEGQAMVPQTLNERYWQTYIDRPPTEDGKGHYVINFSYGARLDRDFMRAIFEALPKSRRPTNDTILSTEQGGGDG
ncbi:MAG: hypothetical protein WC708_01945 [Lentisphaeria bacterium]